MDYNVLEGWLALAAETRRVDKLSSSLGLDSPAFQNSPSSLGSSCGSSGLNTPAQNAFRFLPLLHDFAPELLQTSPRHQASASYPSFLAQSSNNKKTPLQEINLYAPQLDNARSSSDLTRPSSVARMANARVASYQPNSQEQPTQNYSTIPNPNSIPIRPSMQNYRHSSYPAYPSHPSYPSYPDPNHYLVPPTHSAYPAYPAWPPAKPAPLYTDDERHLHHYDGSTTSGDIELDTEGEGEGEGSSTVTTLASPFSPRDASRDPAMFGEVAYSRIVPYTQHPNLNSDMRSVRVGGNDSISPMLSEPFHRLIVKDEEEPMHPSDYPRSHLSSLSNMPRMSHPSEFSSLRDGSGMRTLMEESEDNGEASDWWSDDPFQRDLTFDFEIPSSGPMPMPVPASSMSMYQSRMGANL